MSVGMAGGTRRRQLGLRQPGWYIPWILVAGFGVVLAVNAAMIWFAMSTWTGISTNRAYDKGITYTRNLEAAERQAALGWRATIEMADGAGLDGTLSVRLLDAQDRPLERVVVRADFERPTQQGHDFSLALDRTDAGIYSTPFAAPLPGLWDVRVIATRGDDRLVATRRLVVR